MREVLREPTGVAWQTLYRRAGFVSIARRDLNDLRIIEAKGIPLLLL